MASEEKVLAAIDSAGDGLRVVFVRQGDRWVHRIEQVQGVQATIVWQSIEGDAHDDWPASPALQDLSLEQLPDGRTVIFLVGKAGSSHWSASVEAIADPSQLIFDIACRHGAKAGELGSKYALLVANPGCVFTVTNSPATRLGEEGSAATLTPERMSSEKPLQTTRWKYFVMPIRDRASP